MRRFGARNYHSANFAAVPFQQAHDSNLASVPRAKIPTLAGVHVPRFAADVGFIDFNLAAQFAKRSGLHSLADSVKHEPCALLSHAERPRQFARANAVLRVSNEPDSRKPLVEANRRIFHDGANLDAKLLLTGFAFPKATGGQIRHFAAVTRRAFNAVRPAHLGEKVSAVLSIRKVNDCLLQSLGEFGLFLHGEAMIHERCW